MDLFGALLGGAGGLLSSIFGDDDEPQQTQQITPPPWTENLYGPAVDAATQLASQPYQQYQGMRVAPLNPLQQTAAQLTTDRALYGDPQLNTSRGSLMNIAGGGAMNPFMDNAYTDQMIANNAADMTKAFQVGTANQTDASAALSGAFGGSAHRQKQALDAETLAKQVGNMATATRFADIGRKGGLWNQDINNIMQASSMAPTFSAVDQGAFDALNRYGAQNQNYTQQLFDTQYDEFQQQQAYPRNQLDWYMNTLNRASGPWGMTATSGAGSDPFASAAGGALIGSQLQGLFSGGGGVNGTYIPPPFDSSSFSFGSFLPNPFGS